MRHRLPLALAALALAVTALPASALERPAVLDAAPLENTVKAGVGVVDATWNVGATAGQYADANSSLVENVGGGGDVDPHAHSRIKEKSYGTHSRLSVRAIVVEALDGRRVALLKSDNYLAQDGDYFGTPVNLAARLVGVAEPGEVLAAPEVRDALPDVPARRQEPVDLRGFSAPVAPYALA